MNDELKMIVLRKGKEESLLRFHPWIFSGAIHHTEGGTLEEGDIVEVLASVGRFLAIGHWQIGSIAVRVLTFKRQRIDQAFWQRRLAAALDVRRAIGVAGMVNVMIFTVSFMAKATTCLDLSSTSMALRQSCRHIASGCTSAEAR